MTENCDQNLSVEAKDDGKVETSDGKSKIATSKNGGDVEESLTNKRSKLTSLMTELLADDIVDKEQQTKCMYAKSEPYPHAHLSNLFEPDFLRSIKDEIKSNSKVKFKESDLFRVFQSIDLANLQPDSDETKNQFPNVLKLRELLYSQEWRSFIENIAHLPPSTLTEKIDCACNCHAPGCHLLCHDDVIGTRKVSYIIYLTEDDWKMEEGGSLELYGPQNDQPSSSPIPIARLCPTFNSMAFFPVQPGLSFHAVQEVLGDRPRLSLQGWYHAAKAPENMEQATLSQLKSRTIGKGNPDGTIDNAQTHDTDNQEDELELKFQESAENTFSQDDRKYLSTYLQDIYLTDESMKDIQKKFEDDSSVQLRNLLQEKWVPKLDTAKKDALYDESYYTSGVSCEWKLQGPAHKQRFLEYQPDSDRKDDSKLTGSLLYHLKTKVFESEEWARYLQHITSLGKPKGIKSGMIRRFRPGLDYTVAHYGLLVDKPVLDATLCFVDDSDDQAVWDSGDAGGFECYIEADLDEDDKDGAGEKGAADEYNEEDDTALLSVSASNNTLSLVYRDPGTMRFVKYLSYSAPSSRYDISIEYQVPEDRDCFDEDDQNQANPM